MSEISAAHPAAAVLVVHALVQVQDDAAMAGISVWHEARMIPAWAAPMASVEDLRRRFMSFPPHMPSSYVTREEAKKLHELALQVNPQGFSDYTGAFRKGTAFSLLSFESVSDVSLFYSI